MRTLKEWLEELPDGIRENALDQTPVSVLEVKIKYLLDAIYTFNFWWGTREDGAFWQLVSEKRYQESIELLKTRSPEVYNEYYKRHIEK